MFTSPQIVRLPTRNGCNCWAFEYITAHR